MGMSEEKAEMILYRLDKQDEKLDKIHEQAVKTNGRVTGLELWRARVEGAKQAYGWVPAGSIAIAAAVAGWALSHF